VADEDFEVLRRAWAAFSRLDEEGLRALMDEEIEIVPFGAAMEGKVYRGHDEVMHWWHHEVLANWEVFHVIPEDFRRVGDRLLVTGHWHARGKESGVELDLPATWIVDVRDGKLVAWRTYTDRSEALRELGLEGQA
jgi:ketosteroid isomerase-like protein